MRSPGLMRQRGRMRAGEGVVEALGGEGAGGRRLRDAGHRGDENDSEGE